MEQVHEEVEAVVQGVSEEVEPVVERVPKKLRKWLTQSWKNQ